MIAKNKGTGHQLWTQCLWHPLHSRAPKPGSLFTVFIYRGEDQRRRQQGAQRGFKPRPASVEPLRQQTLGPGMPRSLRASEASAMWEMLVWSRVCSLRIHKVGAFCFG